MKKEKYVLFLFFVATATFIATGWLRSGARGQENEEVGEAAAKVEAVLAKMGPTEKEMWQTARRLEGMGISAAPALLDLWPKLDFRPQLACAWALSRLGHRQDVLDWVLERIKEEKDDARRLTYCEFLGAVAGGRDAKQGEADRIETLLDEIFEPRVKIALCRVLGEKWGARRAKTELKAILESDQEDVRILAALTLAELGDVASGRRILQKLRTEPTDRGRLARSLLREYHFQRILERSHGASVKNKHNFSDKVLDELRQIIQENYVDSTKTHFQRITQKAAAGMITALDPECAYLDADVLDRMRRRLSGEIAGVGIVVGISAKHKEGEDIRRVPVVVASRWGSPAEQAGLKPMLEIWEVDGETAIGKSLVELEGMIAGKAGTKVTLNVYHSSWFRDREITLERAPIEPAGVMMEMLPAGLAVLKVPSLRMETGPALLEKAKAALSEGAKALVLDLRDTADGSFEAAVEGAAVFLKKGSLVYKIKGRNPKQVPEKSFVTATEQGVSVPVAVLVNAGTAGAAEVLAGALSDHGRATLIGEETFGKGSLQEIFLLKSYADRQAVKLTVAYVRLPERGTFHGKGLAPDRVVPHRVLEMWRHDEVQKVAQAGHVTRYLETHWAENAELFKKLAHHDGLEPNAYPDFEAWFRSTGTKAERGDLRRLLHGAVRKRLFNETGVPFITDLQEDGQLQCAVTVLADAVGLSLPSIPEYKPFAGKFK